MIEVNDSFALVMLQNPCVISDCDIDQEMKRQEWNDVIHNSVAQHEITLRQKL